MKSGVQCVMTLGIVLMPVWPADNWDSHVTVRCIPTSQHWSLNNCNIHNIDAVARTNAFYGQGSGPINIDDPGCTGSEQRLIDCPFSPIHNCAHSEDAGVDCNPTSK